MENVNMSNGKIAVVLCNYNDSRFLIDVVHRIARQEPDEFIIVDDGSTDRSIELLKNLSEVHNYKLQIICNDGKHGPFGTFVKGCQFTDAEYIACFSADDYPNPGYLKTMRKVIKDFPLVDLYTCNADVIREGDYYERILFPFTAYVSPDYAVKIFQAGFAKDINLCGVLMKRQLVLDCWEKGGKNTEVNFDCMFTYFSVFQKGFVSIGEKLATYRSYPNSFGAMGSNKKIKQAISKHKFMYNFYPDVYKRAEASGIWGIKARWKALIALWGIMKLPKWARVKFYKWFYSYRQEVEKL